jgi:hypothetical protein
MVVMAYRANSVVAVQACMLNSKADAGRFQSNAGAVRGGERNMMRLA